MSPPGHQMKELACIWDHNVLIFLTRDSHLEKQEARRWMGPAEGAASVILRMPMRGVAHGTARAREHTRDSVSLAAPSCLASSLLPFLSLELALPVFGNQSSFPNYSREGTSASYLEFLPFTPP